MNRIFLTFFITFSFSIFAQEIDCDKMYDEAINEYSKKFGDIKTINYDELGKLIVKNFDYKKIKSQNIILLLPGAEECSIFIPVTKCKNFNPEIPYYSEFSLWNGENMLLLQSLSKKNVIPKNQISFFDDKTEFEHLFKTKKFKIGVMKLAKVIWEPNSDKNFYYFPANSKKLILMRGDAMKNANAFENSIVETRVKHINSKQVRIEYIFKYFDFKNYYQVYEYIDGKWEMTENNSL